jgi:hypothetical protein
MGAFSRAIKKGATHTEAQAFVNARYPVSAEQIAFENELQLLHQPFPWISFFGIVLTIIQTNAAYQHSNQQMSLFALIGYELTMISYALVCAGVFRGTFLVLKLKTKRTVFGLALFLFAVGVGITNSATLQ